MSDPTTLRDMLDHVSQQRSEIPEPAELQARALWIERLFACHGCADEHRARLYLEETAEIPLAILAAAVRGLIRTRVYPTLPTIGDLWQVARTTAGMDRAQYRAGYYLPPPREWPPAGTRYAITAGELEPLPHATPDALLVAGARSQQIGSGE